MNRDLPYPMIMEPGQLRKLNDDIINMLGTPIFFVVPDPSRPKTYSVNGRLYEIITGLYVIYIDYGVRLLSAYLTFCTDNVDPGGSSMQRHYRSVKRLRGGFCHGCIPGGSHAYRLTRAMDYYLHPSETEWPASVENLTEGQCKTIITKLAANSDKLIRYIRDCASKIQKNPELLKRWRELIVDKVMNKNIPRYGKNEMDMEYFDPRIVNDLAEMYRAGKPRKPYAQVVRTWLSQMEPKLLRGSISSSDELRDSLADGLDNLYCPSSLDDTESSADLLMQDEVIWQI